MFVSRRLFILCENSLPSSLCSFDDRDQGGLKRLNLGQSAYSVRSAEQSQRVFPAAEPRFNNQDSRFLQTGGPEGHSFTPGSGLSGPRASPSIYTPTYTDNKSRGNFTGPLLQPSQQHSLSLTRRGSFSFSQRRKLSRRSEGSIFRDKDSTSLAAASNSTSSAYASASVAKKILDTLSELQTPIEEARHRPLAVNLALRTSTEAIDRSKRLAVETVPHKSVENATVKTNSSPGTFNWAFPSIPSVGLAAVAAASSMTPATPAFSFAAPKSASVITESARIAKTAAVTAAPPVHPIPSFTQSTSILKTPRTPNNVRFAANDSEFTFGDPSEVEGVDTSEIERVLSTPGTKRDEKIRFAFSPPGKSMMSSDRGRKKSTPHEDLPKTSVKVLATTPLATPVSIHCVLYIN